MPVQHPLEQPPPLPTFGERVRAKARQLPAWVTLLLRLRSRRTTELWIGDSHAMTFVQEEVAGMFQRSHDGRLVLRAGARLMWSLATRGYPPRVMRVVGLISRYGRRGAFLPVFVAGEIDVRVHLVRRPAETYDFVAAYVGRAMGLARAMHATRAAFVVAPPPSDMAAEVWYPMVGSVGERVAVWRRLRDALAAAVAEYPDAMLLDFTDLMSDERGALRRECTTDGCHTSPEVAAMIRQRIDREALLTG